MALLDHERAVSIGERVQRSIEPVRAPFASISSISTQTQPSTMNKGTRSMTKYNPLNIQIRNGISSNFDAVDHDSALFEVRSPWLERFGIYIRRCCHPRYSLWFAACSFLPLVLFCSPRNWRIWLDRNDNTIDNKMRWLFGLPEVWIDAPEVW